jgi:hypothetical protein
VARVRTLRQAAAWIERAGLALLLPKASVAGAQDATAVLDSIAGSRDTGGFRIWARS